MPNCPKCGSFIADEDRYCPHCGQPVTEENQSANKVVKGIAIGFFVILILGFAVFYPDAPSKKHPVSAVQQQETSAYSESSVKPTAETPKTDEPVQPKTTSIQPEISKTIIHDDEILTITVTGMEYDPLYNTYNINTVIQNHSHDTISYFLNGARVNGYTISTFARGDIFGETESKTAVCLSRDALQLAGIKSIQEIRFSFECSYEEQDEPYCTVSATLPTSLYSDEMDIPVFEGIEAYASDDYRILVAPYAAPSVEQPLIVYIENRTDTPLLLSYDGVAINKQMVETFSSGPYVLANSRYVEVRTIAYFGDEPDIDVIDSVTIAFQICPYQKDGSFSTADVIEVPPVTFSYT